MIWSASFNFLHLIYLINIFIAFLLLLHVEKTQLWSRPAQAEHQHEAQGCQRALNWLKSETSQLAHPVSRGVG